MEKMYNQNQAAEYTGKGIMTIRRAIESGKLVGVEVSPRIRVFTKTELDTWVKTVGTKGRPRKEK